jgi:N-acyl-L-homoserine lactone synthetase
MENPKTSFVSFSTLSEDGALFTGFLRARREVFIEGKGWDLPCCHELEFDQYDTPQAVYSIVHTEGRILGGQRFIPTTARCMMYSYMLRDAQENILPQLPTDILYEKAPQESSVWETTRAFVMPDLSPGDQNIVRRQMAADMINFSQEYRVGSFIAISSRSTDRLAKRGGGFERISIDPIGPVFSDNKAQIRAFRFAMPLRG